MMMICSDDDVTLNVSIERIWLEIITSWGYPNQKHSSKNESLWDVIIESREMNSDLDEDGIL